MVFTAIGIISMILNIIFLIVISLLLIKYFQMKRQVNSLVKELGNDSLEHYLNEIKKRGFEFIMKPKDKKNR